MHRRAFLSLALSLAVPAAAQPFDAKELAAASADPKAYTIDELSVEIETLERTEGAIPPSIGIAQEGIAPDLDAIVNIGMRLWKIVEDNRPVVDVRTHYASALPKGVDASALEGWQPAKGTVYQLKAKNLYGSTVVKLRYQVLRTSGGRYKGAGRYLTAVAVEPLLLEVAWGYRFSLGMEVPDSSVVNVGTSDTPVAAMLALLGWHVSTAVSDSRGKSVHYLQGDGVYQDVGGPFKRPGHDRVRAEIAKPWGERLTSGT